MQAALVDGTVESLRIGVGFLWTAAWAIIMGLVITSLGQVYERDRVHGSQPMLYVAIGFLFVSIRSVIEGVLFDVVGLSIFLSGTIKTTSSPSGWS